MVWTAAGANRQLAYSEPMNPAELHDQALGTMGAMTELRRRMHRWPELGNDLPKTRDAVLEHLDGLPLEITLHHTTSGIAALLEGGRPGPTVLLRGDMDALPLHEDTGIEHTSERDGMMHACGHDLHTSMLMGAARMLSERREEIGGRVLFMFQPGEEGYGGADLMLGEGLIDLPARADGSESPVTGAYALHVTSMLPTGVFATRSGPLLASADVALITVTGRGGHASAPHQALDPIPVACEIVLALQTMITRRVDVFDPAVVTVGRIDAGTTNNIIPETARIEATMRTVSARTRAAVQDSIRRVAEGIAAAHGAAVDVEIVPGYPVTVNSAAGAALVTETAGEVFGERRVVHMPAPLMGAEDFSYVLERLPGAMVFLGATPDGKDPAVAAPNHSNRVFFDEATMAEGATMYAALALEHLAR